MQTDPQDNSRINLEYLYELSEGSQEFVNEMLQMFVSTVPEALQEIKTAIDSLEWEKVRSVAHRIKPSFGFIGAAQPEDLLRQMEINTMELPDPVLQRKLISEIEEHTQMCINEIVKELEAKSI